MDADDEQLLKIFEKTASNSVEDAQALFKAVNDDFLDGEDKFISSEEVRRRTYNSTIKKDMLPLGTDINAYDFNTMNVE